MQSKIVQYPKYIIPKDRIRVKSGKAKREDVFDYTIKEK